jgi:hypothetical protein
MQTNRSALLLIVFFATISFGCGNKTDPHIVASQPLSVNVQMDFGKLFVTDNDGFSYTNPVITLRQAGVAGDGYTLHPGDLAPGSSKTYSLSDFTKSDGSKVDAENTHAVDVQVVCDTDKGKQAGFWSGAVRD